MPCRRFPPLIQNLLWIFDSANIGTAGVTANALLNAVFGILMFYLAMAIGGSAKRHKKTCSILAFIVIVILFMAVQMILLNFWGRYACDGAEHADFGHRDHCHLLRGVLRADDIVFAETAQFRVNQEANGKDIGAGFKKPGGRRAESLYPDAGGGQRAGYPGG